jgi:hypothetical protein
MNTVVVTLHRPASESCKSRAAGANAGWLVMKPVREPDAPGQPVWFAMASIWCGAMVGCIGAMVTPPFSDSDLEGIRANGRKRRGSREGYD